MHTGCYGRYSMVLWLLLAAPALGQDGHRAAPSGPAHSGSTATPAMPLTPAERAEKRFPQPVRVGDLAGRLVLEPSNRQGVIGRVAGVVRDADGVKLVVATGGLLGFGTRAVAVPIEMTALLGQFVQVVDMDPAQLRSLPDWQVGSGAAVAADDRVRIGLNRN